MRKRASCPLACAERRRERSPVKTESHSIRGLVLFSAGAAPAAIVIGVLNRYLYGSIFESGYGHVTSIYHWSNLSANVSRYPLWLIETQTPVVVAAALPLLSRRAIAKYPAVGSFGIRAGLALFLALTVVPYLFYIPYDQWWFLRFLLPAFPLLLILCVGGLRATAGFVSRRAPALLLIPLILFVLRQQLVTARDRGVWDMSASEQRYVVVASEVVQMTPLNSIYFAMQESGSLHYYTRRPIVRYDLLSPESLDRAIEVLAARGFHPYFVLEEEEERVFCERFALTRSVRALESPPLRRWSAVVPVALFDGSLPPARASKE